MNNRPDRENDRLTRPTGGTSRRELLRKGSAAVAAGVGGLVAASSTGRAHTCPRPADYWYDHPDAWPSFPSRAQVLVLDGHGNEQWFHPHENRSRLLGEMGQQPGEDMYLHLVEQYLAARINWEVITPRPEAYDDFWEWVGRYIRWVRAIDRPQTEWTASGIDAGPVYHYFRALNHAVGWDCERAPYGSSTWDIRPR